VAAEYEILRAKLEGLESARQDLFTGIRNLNLSSEVGAMNVRPIERAVAASFPFFPSTSTTLFYSLAIGGLAGLVLALLRDWTDQRLRSAEEIQQVLGLPVLGIVPHMTGAHTPAERGRHLHLEPMSDVAESYRTVRTAVYFGQPEAVAKTLLITSPAPGDGKTTLASNLAIAMAQAGNRILLLDADFRKPTQHKIFELTKRTGLSNVLAGEAKLDEVIQSTTISGLDILPCGPIPANPSEILNSQTFADLLEQLKARYDHVLLDSPPVMPVTDARILAASCDATLLSLRAEKTTRKGALYARDTLRSVGSQILGVVVNDVPRRKGIYGYYYSDTELYMYGYGRRRGGSGSSSGTEKGNGAANGSANGAAAETSSTGQG
jgi:capsular exopolysaccharide synthesis family protein